MSIDSARILIIDDSQGMQQLYASLAAEAGATATLAGTWDVARAALEEQPNLVVVDVRQLMNGEGCSALRDHAQRTPASFIIVTVSGPEQGRQVREVMANGQVETLVMPFEIEEFERRIPRRGGTNGARVAFG